jgi:hypothetical protein
MTNVEGKKKKERKERKKDPLTRTVTYLDAHTVPSLTS